MTITVEKPKPDDPVLSNGLSDCVHGGVDEGIEGSVAHRSQARISVMRRFADEIGTDLKGVTCRASHGRVFTRQEVWDDQGRDHWEDDKYDEWLYAFRKEHDRQPTAEERDAVEWPETPEIVPDDWEWSDRYYAWTECKAEDSGAVEIWICEEKRGVAR